MASSIIDRIARTSDRRRLRRRLLAEGRVRDARDLPFTEGQAVSAPGRIGPGLPVVVES